MIQLGVLTPGTSFVRLTAASGTAASHLDNKDIAINTLFVQSDSGNDAVGTLEYCGDELASLNDPGTTGDLPTVKIESPSGVPNALNLKQFRIKGDSNDKYRCWATQN